MKNLALLLMLVANVLLCAALFFQHDAKDLEITKVGGIENYKQIQMLYKSDAYKATQTQAIAQFEAQLVQLANQVSTGDADETFADR